MKTHGLLPALWVLAGLTRAGRLSCGNQQDTVEAHSGDAVHLPCPFTWVGEDPSEYMVVWQLTRGENLTVVHDRADHTENTEQDPRFRDRTGLGPDWFTEGNATLSIRKLDLGDGGMYTCLITTVNPYSRAMCAETTVSVQEGTEAPATLKSSGYSGSSWENLTYEGGVPPDRSELPGASWESNEETNIVVSAIFVVFVTTLMSIAIYFALKRRGCEQRSWEERAAQETMIRNSEKPPV
ncbi:CD276 antigen-like [Heptranchias perlo]|uniref:CD276 antigen-like n=1 Tax=Heptranchias perlo TaxID=212740 RepID=UPI0035594CC2